MTIRIKACEPRGIPYSLVKHFRGGNPLELFRQLQEGSVDCVAVLEDSPVGQLMGFSILADNPIMDAIVIHVLVMDPRFRAEETLQEVWHQLYEATQETARIVGRSRVAYSTLPTLVEKHSKRFPPEADPPLVVEHVMAWPVMAAEGEHDGDPGGTAG